MTKQNNNNNNKVTLDKCPYCESPTRNTYYLPIDEVIKTIESGSFAFLGFGTDGEVAKRRGQEFYHCYKCRRSIVLAYDQFL